MNRVLILLDSLYSNAGGGTEKQFLRLYQHCSEINIEPYVAFLRDAEIHHKITWKRSPLTLHLSSFISLNLIVSLWRLLRYIRDRRISIIQTFYDDSAILCAILGLLAPDIKIIMSLRNMGHDHKGIKRSIMQIVYKKAARILVNSRAIAAMLTADYGVDSGKIHVIYNFIDRNPESIDAEIDQEFDEIRKNHKFIILVVSNLRHVKGIDTIIKAMEMYKNPEVAIVIIGAGDDKNTYQLQINKKKLNNIYLLGYKDNINYYLNRSDAGLLASRSEGLSNALLEYAIAGLPVIATNVGGNPEVLDSGNCGILVPSNDPAALSRAMNELINGPELRKELGSKIYQYANTHFIDSSIIEGFRDIYDL